MERGAAQAGPLTPKPGSHSRGNWPVAAPPDFVFLPIFATLGFPPSSEAAVGLSPLAPTDQRLCTAPSRRLLIGGHTVGGRREDAPSAQGCT